MGVVLLLGCYFYHYIQLHKDILIIHLHRSQHAWMLLCYCAAIYSRLKYSDAKAARENPLKLQNSSEGVGYSYFETFNPPD